MRLEKLEVPLELSKKGFDIGIAGAIAGVTAIVGAVGLAIKSTFDWANELDSLQDVMGITNKEAAALAATARKSGVPVETLTKGFTNLEKGLVKSNGQLDVGGKALKNWGINAKDANGVLKDQSQLIKEISGKYNTLSTAQEKVNFLTEVFGKSGADMIDFFDTLAADGGIDAVADKMERLGLAIDPERYVKFNQSLEEIKLMGLGLAVGLTEKLMPVLEGMLDWTSDWANADAPTKIRMLKDAFKSLLGITESFKTWADDVDWAGLSQKFAEKINSIDWATLGLGIREGVSNVLQGIDAIVTEIDWKALEQAMGTALADLVAGLYGYPDWEGLAHDINNGFATIFGYTTDNAFEDLKTDLTTGFNFIYQNWSEMLKTMGDVWTLELAVMTLAWGLFWTGANISLGLFIGFFQTKLDEIKTKFTELTTILSTVFNGMIDQLELAWDRFRRAAVQAINVIIAAINSIPSVNIPSIGGSSGSKGGRPGTGRASGGSVIAGQSYNVGEYRAEVFTPNHSGRIDQKSNEPLQAEISDSAMRKLASILSVELAKVAS